MSGMPWYDDLLADARRKADAQQAEWATTILQPVALTLADFKALEAAVEEAEDGAGYKGEFLAGKHGTMETVEAARLVLAKWVPLESPNLTPKGPQGRETTVNGQVGPVAPASGYVSRCVCGHLRSSHSRGSLQNSGPCVAAGCHCRGFSLGGGGAA